jgi:streptogramin lyase
MRLKLLISVMVAVFLLVLAMAGMAMAALSAQEMQLNSTGEAYEIHPDTQGSFWVTDYAAGEIWQVNATGTSYNKYAVGGFPQDATPDNLGFVWWVDGTSLYALDTSTQVNNIRSWDVMDSNTLWGVGFTPGLVWLTDNGLANVYSFNKSDRNLCIYSLPVLDITPDIYYPFISGTQLWLGDRNNGTILRLDFTSTPTWTWWQLPAGSSPSDITLDGQGNIWYTDNLLSSIGLLSPSADELMLYNLPVGAGTDPVMLTISGGKVWYTEQGLGTMGSLDPSTNPPTPMDVTSDSEAATVDCTTYLAPPTLDTAAPTHGEQTPSSASYDTQYTGDGWSIYKLPNGSNPFGISFTSSGYAVDNGRQKLIIFTPSTAPTLIVKKIVINNNGGMLTPSNFSFSINGGTAIAFEADGRNELTVDAGSYSVTEPDVAGYTASYSADCTGTIAAGQTKTCTITNDDTEIIRLKTYMPQIIK